MWSLLVTAGRGKAWRAAHALLACSPLGAHAAANELMARLLASTSSGYLVMPVVHSMPAAHCRPPLSVRHASHAAVCHPLQACDDTGQRHAAGEAAAWRPQLTDASCSTLSLSHRHTYTSLPRTQPRLPERTDHCEHSDFACPRALSLINCDPSNRERFYPAPEFVQNVRL